MLNDTSEFSRQRAQKLGMVMAQKAAKRRNRHGQVLPPGGYNPDVRIDPLELPPDVVMALEQSDMAKDERKKFEIITKLEIVQDRVKVALGNVGLEPDLHRTQSEIQEMFQEDAKVPVFDTHKRRMEKAHQRHVMETIDNCTNSMQQQKEILGDVNEWLDSNDSILDGCSTNEEMDEKKNEYEEVFSHVEDALKYASDMAEHVKVMGFELLREAGYLDTDDEDENSSRTPLPPPTNRKNNKDICDDATMLSDPNSFLRSLSEVRQVLEKSVRMVRKNQEKKIVRSAVKQYKFITKAVESKDIELKELRSEVGKFELATKTWKADFEQADKKAQNLEKRLSSLQSQHKDLKVCNVNLMREIEDLKESHEAEIDELLKRQLSPSDESEINLARESGHDAKLRRTSTRSLLKATESAISAATKQLRDELEEHRQQMEEQNQIIRSLEKQQGQEKQDNAKLEMRLAAKAEMANKMAMMAANLKSRVPDMAHRSSFDAKMKEEMFEKLNALQAERDDFEQQINDLSLTLSSKQEVIDHHEMYIADLKHEMGVMEAEEFVKYADQADARELEVKRMVQRMKREFDLEINRLKTHIDKENQRNEAVLRKQDLAHRDQLAATYKQCLHLLRAVNRFKENVAQMLDNEGLSVAAKDMRKANNLPTEEVPNDARMLLTQVAGLTVELFVAMEFTLAQALMSRRLEIKDSCIAKNTVSKDLEVQTEATNRAKYASEGLLEKLRQVQSKLAMAEGTLAHMKKIENVKQQGVTTRYRNLLGQYMMVQRDMDKLQNEYRDTNKHKDRALRSVISDKHSIARVVNEQQLTINKMEQHFKRTYNDKKRQYRFSITDQKRNLRILEQALHQNQISQETYEITMGLVKESMELPQIKLRYLFERYIAHCRYKTTKEEITKQLSDRLLGNHNRHEVKGYLKRVDKRMLQADKVWKGNCQRMEINRTQLFDQMDSLFNDLIIQGEIFLIPPEPSVKAPPSECGKVHQSPDTSGSCSGTANTQLPDLSRTRSPKVPPEIQGTSLSLQAPKEAMWELPTITKAPPPTLIDVPLIVDLEVNERMRAAKKALQRARFRQNFPIANAQVVDYGKSERILHL